VKYDFWLVDFLTNPTTWRGHRGCAGDASPHQTERGVDMTLDFIENHRQIKFCTAHYLIAKDSKS